MKDVGTSNPTMAEKYANKIGMVPAKEVSVGPKIKQTTSISPYIVQLFILCFIPQS